MNIDEIRNLTSSEEYDFLRTNKHLGENIILLGLGGSHAYGTNIETSDVDIRGIYMNPKEEIIGIYSDKEQIVDAKTDTTVYSFKKIIKLLSDCNPNTIELLGLRDSDYIAISDTGKILLKNRHLFLSQKAIYTFGNYAASQLNRLVNKSGRYKDETLSNEVRSIEKAISSFESRYKQYADSKSDVRVYEKNNELFFTLNVNNISMNILSNMLNEIDNIGRSYRKSARNDRAISHNKLSKHMMHLLRLYMMGIDILENEEIVTYREKEHDLLMDIRSGHYLEADGVTPTKDFEKILAEYQEKFKKASENTKLPERADMDSINKMVMKIVQMYI